MKFNLISPPATVLFFAAGLLFAQPDAPEERSTAVGKNSSWLTPPPSEQLYAEGLDDQKGMGRIFVPAMTSSANEPNYAVYLDGEIVGEKPMGSSFFLMPGAYVVQFGTGALDQRMVQEVEIHRGETVIIEPVWSALTIEVLDETRNYVKQDLQIYRIETLESFGVIPAINPELGEQLQTLLLKPGLYKIVERGRDINTFENFATVLLEAGTYTPFTIIIDSQTRSFIGSGILTAASQIRQRRNLKLYGAAHGSVILNASNNVASRTTKTNLTILTQFENRLLYDKLPHYYLTNNLIELGALRQQGETFQITQDRVQLKNTYVYYLLGWLGGYSRFEVTTHLFTAYARFNTSRNVILRNLDGVERRLTDVDRVKLEPPLFPLNLKEGLGVNVTPLRTFQARVSIRTGLGYRQSFNNGVYQQAEADTIYKRVEDSFLRGLEASFVSNVALMKNLTVTSEFDVLFPFGAEREPVLDLENIVSLSVTRNISLEHVFRLNRSPELNWSLVEQFVLVRFSYFVF